MSDPSGFSLHGINPSVSALIGHHQLCEMHSVYRWRPSSNNCIVPAQEGLALSASDRLIDDYWLQARCIDPDSECVFDVWGGKDRLYNGAIKVQSSVVQIFDIKIKQQIRKSVTK